MLRHNLSAVTHHGRQRLLEPELRCPFHLRPGRTWTQRRPFPHPGPAQPPQVLQHPPAVQFLVFLERFFHSRETEVGTVNLSFPTLPRYGHLHLMFTGGNCLLIRNIDIPSFTKADSFIYKI